MTDEFRALRHIAKRIKFLSRSSIRWLIERLEAELDRAPPDPPIRAPIAKSEPAAPHAKGEGTT